MNYNFCNAPVEQSGSSRFSGSRWQIIDLSAYLDKIEKGFKSYSVSDQSWEKSVLGDRIPRWQVTKIYKDDKFAKKYKRRS